MINFISEKEETGRFICFSNLKRSGGGKLVYYAKLATKAISRHGNQPCKNFERKETEKTGTNSAFYWATIAETLYSMIFRKQGFSTTLNYTHGYLHKVFAREINQVW